MEEKIDYFIEETNRRLINIERDCGLMVNRWYLFYGGAMVISSIVSMFVAIYFR